MLFRQLFDRDTCTYTYLLADDETREAVIIDPVRELVERDCALIEELSLKLLFALDTHLHADHVTGAGLLRKRLGAKTVVSAPSGVEGADVYLKHGDAIGFGAHSLGARLTPGHTDGCVTFVLEDGGMVFTGDALLIRGTGRTDFQQGDPKVLFQSIHEQIFSLPDETLVYPGHDYAGRLCSTVFEEKKFNPRVATDRSERDFVGVMENLNLPYPKRLDVALPANTHGGLPEGYTEDTPLWSAVHRSWAGIPEVVPEWVASHAEGVRVIDVRSKDEFDGELGHIDAAELYPMEELADAAAKWSTDQRVVIVCRSGARSAQAAKMLEQKGFGEVASMRGGMLRWHEEDRPLAPAT